MKLLALETSFASLSSIRLCLKALMNISYSCFPLSLNMCHYKSSAATTTLSQKKALHAAAFISHIHSFSKDFFGSCHFIMQKYMEGHACHISTQKNLRSTYRQKYAHSFLSFFFFSCTFTVDSPYLKLELAMNF